MDERLKSKIRIVKDVKDVGKGFTQAKLYVKKGKPFNLDGKIFLNKDGRMVVVSNKKIGRIGISTKGKYPSLRIRERYVYIHKIVASTFFHYRNEEGISIHHDNGDKFDFSFKNLVVLTREAHDLLHGKVIK